MTLSNNLMTNDIKDIKVPIDIPNQWEWLLIALLIILLISLGFLLWLWYSKLLKKQEIQEPLPVIPAWQKAYDRLENLKLKKLIEREDLKPFYVELSNILRHYIEERFVLKAPEMTSEEFLDSLKRSPFLDDAQKQTLKDFLFICDMVKFAKHNSSAFEAQKCFDLTKQFIDQTCLPAGKAHGI